LFSVTHTSSTVTPPYRTCLRRSFFLPNLFPQFSFSPATCPYSPSFFPPSFESLSIPPLFRKKFLFLHGPPPLSTATSRTHPGFLVFWFVFPPPSHAFTPGGKSFSFLQGTEAAKDNTGSALPFFSFFVYSVFLFPSRCSWIDYIISIVVRLDFSLPFFNMSFLPPICFPLRELQF